jgi:hypothetical protein
MEFKLSPLILFIILLVVLALSAMIKNYMNREGFITYNHSGALFSTKTVGIYSSENPVTKIYDDIYYDPRNGNVVVVYTKDAYTNAGSVDADGKNIKSIEIVPRKNVANNQIVKYENNTVDRSENGVSKAEAINQVTPESRKSTLDTTDVAWSYKSGSNQVNYFTWGSNTYIYVMDITGITTSGNSFASDAQGNSFASRGNSYSGAVKHASGAFYTGSINPNISFDFTGVDGDSNTDIYVTNSYPQQTNDGYDDKSLVEPVYHPSRPVYQITSTIKYDIANGNLLIITPTTTPKTIDVYFRSGEDKREDDSTPNVTLTNVADAQASSAPYILQSFSKSVSKPFFVQDHANKNTVMYWPSGENTLIVVFENRNASGYIPIKKTVRFTSSGVWTSPTTSATSSATPSGDASGNTPDISGNYGDFWKWWSYFNSNAVGGLSNDYMLKTQIVPPVCPSCPACQGGACTNCGGHGGSGSMASDGSSLALKSSSVDGVKGPSSAAASIGQSAGQTITNTAAIAGLTTVGTGAIAADLAGKTIGTAGNIVGKTVDTAGNIVNRTFDTAGNIVDRTFDTAGNVVNTTGNLLYSAGSGVSNLLSSDPRRTGYEQSYRGPRPGSNNTGIYQPMGNPPMGTPPMGTSNAGGQRSGVIDPYTYNGALQSKGSNFRPVTTDFSSFGL